MAEAKILTGDDFRAMRAQVLAMTEAVPEMRNHPVLGIIERAGLGGALRIDPDGLGSQLVGYLLCELVETMQAGAELAVRNMQTSYVGEAWKKAAIECSSVAASLDRVGFAKITSDRRDAIAFVARNAGTRDDVLPVTNAGAIYAADNTAPPTKGPKVKRLDPEKWDEPTLSLVVEDGGNVVGLTDAPSPTMEGS